MRDKERVNKMFQNKKGLGKFGSNYQNQQLDYIIKLKENNGYIPELKNFIFNMSEEDIDNIIEGNPEKVSFYPYGELRDEQTLGVAFLITAHNALLGDSVGLGKTAQISGVINYLAGLYRNNNKPFRYIFFTEKKLVTQTRRELVRFTGHPVLELQGLKKDMEYLVSEGVKDFLGGIIAPHSVLKQPLFLTWLDSMSELLGKKKVFDLLVIDESSIINNKGTKQEPVDITKSAWYVREYADRKILLNATPFESHLESLYNQLDFIDDELLPDIKTFRDMFFVWDEDKGEYSNHVFKNDNMFRKEIRYHYFGNTRENLGAKIYNSRLQLKAAPLSQIQENMYSLSSMYDMIHDCPQLIHSGPEPLPFNEETTPKLRLLRESLSEIYPDIVVPPETPTSTIRTVYMFDETEDNQFILDSENRQTLIFAHYTENHKQLKEYLITNYGFTAEYVNGRTNKANSDDIINRFKNEEIDILITNLKKGLNFGKVSNVIFYSYVTNPNSMLQMEGRVTRDFHISNKNFYILTMFGKELDTLENYVTKTMNESKKFSNSDISLVSKFLESYYRY